MSIATLKRKTNYGGGSTRNDPISGKGINGFSLAGGYRNIGSVGQFRMVSNATRTPFRGNEPIGSGGCCGSYTNKPLNSGYSCTNNSDIIKPSSLNTKGMISTKYRWIKSKYPNYWVQPIENESNPLYSQGLYIANVTNKVGGCVRGSSFISEPENTQAIPCKGQKCVYYIGTKKYIRRPYSKVLNNEAISQGQYIETGGVAKNNCLPTPLNQQPFPMSVNNNGCDINFTTWEQAQEEGVLPPNYVG